MSVVLTVKVEGLIVPPLAQMASTKACYKLGLNEFTGTFSEIRLTPAATVPVGFVVFVVFSIISGIFVDFAR